MITIEKKDTRPKVKDIQMLFNHVLLKMDPSYESYQFSGKETGILASPIIYDKGKQIRVEEKLVNPFGEVMKVPSALVYNGKKIAALVKKYQPVRSTDVFNEDGEPMRVIANYSALHEINQLKRSSVSYDTDIEVQVGDRVHVNYLHFLNAKQDGLFVDTEEGRMVMVKYDLLRMTVDENNQPKKMLNGYVLIEPEQYDVDIKKENGNSIIETASGIALLNATNTKKTRKRQKGFIVVGGTFLRGYLEEPHKSDRAQNYKKGDRILYDPRFSVKLENDVHQIISEKDLYLIRRDGIIADSYEYPDFDKIEI